jgi:hypothetical protein
VTTLTDPTLAIQTSFVRVLKSADTLAGKSIFCPAPMSAAYPYVSIGQIQVINERYEGLEGAQVHVTVHAWSRAESRQEIRTLAAQIVAALDGAEGVLTGQDLTANTCMLEQMLYLDDPDGKSSRAVLTFQVLTD